MSSGSFRPGKVRNIFRNISLPTLSFCSGQDDGSIGMFQYTHRLVLSAIVGGFALLRLGLGPCSGYPDKLIVNADPPQFLKLRASAMEGLFLCAATVIEIFSGAVREALLATRLSPEVEIARRQRGLECARESSLSAPHHPTKDVQVR